MPLAEQYSGLLAFAAQASRYKRRIIWRLILVYSFMPWKFFPIFRHYLKFIYSARALLVWNWTEYIGQVPEHYNTIFDTVASKQQRENPLFAVFVNRYPLIKLADLASQKFSITVNDARQLIQLNELRRKNHVSFGMKEVIAVALALAGFLLNVIPKEFIEAYFQVDYATYKVQAFEFALVVAGYLFILLGPILLSNIRHKRDFLLCEILLTLCLINRADDSGEADMQAGQNPI